MVRHASMIAGVLLPLAIGSISACGGDKKPTPKKPVVKKPDDKIPDPPRVTEEDREKQRREAALAIIPDGTTCLPVSLKEANAPRLEMAAIGADAVICANDVDRSRLLGPIACWKADLAEGGLIYQNPNPLPGRNLTVKLEDRCARGFCLPKEAKLPEDKLAHIAWNEDASKAVMVAGDEVHLFDATARARESGFGLRGDKGVTNTPNAVYWVGDTIFVHGADSGPASYVFAFKLDGTALGPLMSLGGKETMLSTHGGSFVILDQTRVAIAEKGFTNLVTYEVESGKRAKILRKVAPGPCKPPDIEAYWTDGEVPGKCKDHLTKQHAHLIGADVVAGKKNLLVLLRGPRLGELAVLDVKTLAETKSFQLPWCEGSGGGKGDDAKEAPAEKGQGKTRAPTKKPKGEDPDAGGE